jgi:hypothetical protein
MVSSGYARLARLGIKRLDDSGHILPWQNLLHAGEENLFSGLTALSAEFTIGEGELMAHDVPLGCAPDEYDDLISGTCCTLLNTVIVFCASIAFTLVVRIIKPLRYIL